MKMIYTAPSVIPCDLLKSVLEVEGIESMIKNELGSNAAGYGLPVPDFPSLPWAWPEVWVNDEDIERATEIAADFDETQPGDAGS